MAQKAQTALSAACNGATAGCITRLKAQGLRDAITNNLKYSRVMSRLPCSLARQKGHEQQQASQAAHQKKRCRR